MTLKDKLVVYEWHIMVVLLVAATVAFYKFADSIELTATMLLFQFVVWAGGGAFKGAVERQKILNASTDH